MSVSLGSEAVRTIARHVAQGASKGALAGFVAAGSIGFVAFWGALLTHGQWYFPLELIGWSAGDLPANLGGGLQSGTVAACAIAQLATGTCWGALFGGLAGSFIDEMTFTDSASVGAFFGVVAWVVDLSVLMPLGDPKAAIPNPFWLGALFHVAYGGVLGPTWAFLLRSKRRLVLRSGLRQRFPHP
jgi:hypothetical protein